MHFSLFFLSKSKLHVHCLIRQPYAEQPDFQGVTHCVVDRSMPEISKSDKEAMRMAEIHCVTLLYILACIQEDTLPSVKDYAAK